MSLGHCHCRKHATTRGRRRGDGARGGGSGDGRWKDGRGGGRTRTTTGKTKKHQQWEGTPLDNGPDNPFTVGDPSHNLTEGRDNLPGGHEGRRGRPSRWGRAGNNHGGVGGARPPSTVEMTWRTPHPLHPCCCCRRCCCHPPSQRRTSREGCRCLLTPTSTPSTLTRRALSTQTTTGPWWRR